MRLQFRKDTTANLTAENPIPLLAEPIFEIDKKTLKIGDGITPWASLEEFGAGGGGLVLLAEATNPPWVNSGETRDSPCHSIVLPEHDAPNGYRVRIIYNWPTSAGQDIRSDYGFVFSLNETDPAADGYNDWNWDLGAIQTKIEGDPNYGLAHATVIETRSQTGYGFDKGDGSFLRCVIDIDIQLVPLGDGTTFFKASGVADYYKNGNWDMQLQERIEFTLKKGQGWTQNSDFGTNLLENIGMIFCHGQYIDTAIDYTSVMADVTSEWKVFTY